MSSTGAAVSELQPLVVILGATASGKTALAIGLARRFGGEIVSADSRQIYRQMDIGTAKPTPEERAAALHHLIDLVAPDESYSVALYQEAAETAIAEVLDRGHRPLLVGGTGLYITAVCEGIRFPSREVSEALRVQLSERLEREGLPVLANELVRVDPSAAQRVDLHNPRRVLRALELALRGEPGRAWRERPGVARYRLLKLGLTGPRELLRQRVRERGERMFAEGLVEEVQRLLAAAYGPDLPSMSGIGYRQVVRYLRDEISLDEAREQTVTSTQQYLRRQETWFRREKDVRWVDIRSDVVDEVSEAVEEFLLPVRAPG